MSNNPPKFKINQTVLYQSVTCYVTSITCKPGYKYTLKAYNHEHWRKNIPECDIKPKYFDGTATKFYPGQAVSYKNRVGTITRVYWDYDTKNFMYSILDLADVLDSGIKEEEMSLLESNPAPKFALFQKVRKVKSIAQDPSSVYIIKGIRAVDNTFSYLLELEHDDSITLNSYYEEEYIQNISVPLISDAKFKIGDLVRVKNYKSVPIAYHFEICNKECANGEYRYAVKLPDAEEPLFSYVTETDLEKY